MKTVPGIIARWGGSAHYLAQGSESLLNRKNSYGIRQEMLWRNIENIIFLMPTLLPFQPFSQVQKSPRFACSSLIMIMSGGGVVDKI